MRLTPGTRRLLRRAGKARTEKKPPNKRPPFAARPAKTASGYECLGPAIIMFNGKLRIIGTAWGNKASVLERPFYTAET